MLGLGLHSARPTVNLRQVASVVTLVKRFFAVLLGLCALVVCRAPMTPEASAAARPQNFIYDQSCSAPFGLPSVGFALPGTVDLPSLGADGAEQIWIDLSLFNNNFAAGTFIGAGPFVPRHGALEFRWYDLQRPRMHFYRLNALRSGGWIELGRGSFETINCGVVELMHCSIGDPTGVTGAQFGIAPVAPLPGSAALEQWFDLTLFANPQNPMLDNGFAPGTFVGAGPFPVGGTRLWWNGLAPGRRHFYRANVLHTGMVWQPVYSGSFVTLDCRDLPAFDAPG